MAIRLRRINGVLVALCAAETDPASDDVYLDDEVHLALARKFAEDWQGQLVDWIDEESSKLRATQKKRDARETLQQWLN